MKEIKKEDKEILEGFIQTLRLRGLEEPAVFLLEMHKPMSMALSSFFLTLEPLVNAFFRIPGYRKMMELMEDRDVVEWVICQLETKEKNRSFVDEHKN